MWPVKLFSTFNPRIILQSLFTFYVWSIGFSHPSVNAQDRVPVYVELSILPITELTVENKQIFPDIALQDMQRGFIELKEAVLLKVSSNVPWQVSVYSQEDNLYVTPRQFKPIQDFQWRMPGGIYQSISRDPQTIILGDRSVVDKEIILDYRLLLTWGNTPPGHWQFEPVFEISPWVNTP